MPASPPPARILVVEDNAGLRRVLRYGLARHGHTVEAAGTGAEALRRARLHRPDLVVLDLGLPDVDGLEVCRILRSESATPVLVLTGRSGEEARAASLAAGATDHITKPFSMDALRARIRTLLEPDRPGGAGEAVDPTPAPPRVVMGLELDGAAHTVARGGVTVRLAPKEHALLSELLDHPGEVVTRERIAERVWGGEVASNTITVHVLWLREKLAALPPPRIRISAVPGAGYLLDAGDAGR